jgi:hypothetical protein
MYVTHDNIEDYMRKKELLSGVHSTIEVTLMWVYVVCDSIEYRIRNGDILFIICSSVMHTLTIIGLV